MVLEGAVVVNEAAVKTVIVTGALVLVAGGFACAIGVSSVVESKVVVTVAVTLRVGRAWVFVDETSRFEDVAKGRDVVGSKVGEGYTVFVTTAVVVETKAEGKTHPQGGTGGLVGTVGFLTHFPPFLT